MVYVKRSGDMKSRKPVIGVTTSYTFEHEAPFAGYKRTYVNDDYIQAIIRNGGVPLMLPLNTEIDVLEAQLDMVDGIILSGGYDVNPVLYNQQPRQKLGEILPVRDEFEFKVLEIAKQKKLPVLGVCRGLQIMNTFYGGSLEQDLSYIVSENEILKHNQNQTPTLTTHGIVIEEDSWLTPILGKENTVNSFHHQVVKDVAPEFKAVARALDGVVESIEYSSDQFLVAVQWHPEMLKDNEEMNEIFKLLIKKAM